MVPLCVLDNTMFHLVQVLCCFQRLRNYWFIQHVLTSSINGEYSSVGCIKLGCIRIEASFILLMKCPYHATKTNTQQFIHTIPCSLNLKFRYFFGPWRHLSELRLNGSQYPSQTFISPKFVVGFVFFLFIPELHYCLKSSVFKHSQKHFKFI